MVNILAIYFQNLKPFFQNYKTMSKILKKNCRNRIAPATLGFLEISCPTFQLKDKLGADDWKKAMDKCTETLAWLDANQMATKYELVHRKKELEGVCNPFRLLL